jgi:hypothetical protein
MQLDRFAREIVPFLMSSCAARLRRLMRHSFGGYLKLNASSYLQLSQGFTPSCGLWQDIYRFSKGASVKRICYSFVQLSHLHMSSGTCML